MRPSVFYLYNDRAKSDAKLCRDLEAWLYTLYRDERQTTLWHKVSPGAEVHKAQLERMQEADVILVLLTADFLSNDDCYRLAVAALSERERDAIVIPILLRPIADFSGLPLGDLQPLPRNGVPISKWRDKDDAWNHICKEIHSVLEQSAFRSTKRSILGPAAVVAQYRLIRRLASSGGSDVFEAEHSIIGRRVAIKIAKPYVNTSTATATMRREVKGLEAAAHPGVVALHDAGFLSDRSPYIVMELIDGEPISRTVFVSESQPPLWRPLLVAAAQVARTAFALHARGIVHCDLKPTNVLVVRRDGAARRRFDSTIIDFGASRLLHSAPTEDYAELLVGTPAYMSPEQASGQTGITNKTDVFTFGVLLFELFTGQLPFHASSLFEMMRQRVTGLAPTVGSVEPRVPPVLQDLVNGMLARHAVDRPTMAEVEEHLQFSLQACGDNFMPQIVHEERDAVHSLTTVTRDRMSLDFGNGSA